MHHQGTKPPRVSNGHPSCPGVLVAELILVRGTADRRCGEVSGDPPGGKGVGPRFMVRGVRPDVEERHFCRLERTSVAAWSRCPHMTTLVVGFDSAWTLDKSGDGLDVCVRLLIALYLVERKCGLMVGDRQSGYIVVPYGAGLHAEPVARCNQTGLVPPEWVKGFRLRASAP